MTPIKILANAADVIDVLSQFGPQNPAEIAARVGIPRSSVYRMLDTLNSIGLTETLPDSTSCLSLRWLRLADNARSSMREWTGAREILRGLTERTGLTSFLTVQRNGQAVCVEWERGREIGVLVLKPGRTLPLYAGSEGRLLLAYDDAADDYIAHMPTTAFTPNTLTDAARFRADLEEIRAKGFAVSDGDVTAGIGSLAVPVRNTDDSVIGALSVAGLAADLRPQRDDIIRDLRTAAQAFEAKLTAQEK